MPVCVIFRCPQRQPWALGEGYRSVDYQRRWCEAVIECGQIDKRLDRGAGLSLRLCRAIELAGFKAEPAAERKDTPGMRFHEDRKSTRLNSSHLGISYAVFCLK